MNKIILGEKSSDKTDMLLGPDLFCHLYSQGSYFYKRKKAEKNNNVIDNNDVF